MVLEFNGRKVEVTEMDGEINEGCYIQAAYYLDNEADLSEHDMEVLSDLAQSELNEELYQRLIMRSEAWADSLEDR